ncbi:hypothetical protein D3C78_978350 [compost metagenome]
MPVDPLIHPGSGFCVCWIKVQGVVPVRQVPDDRVGLPQHEAVVLNHRNHRIGIQCREFRCVRFLETRAPVLPFERDLQLCAGPEHFADIDR